MSIAPAVEPADRRRMIITRVVAGALGLAALVGIAFSWFMAGLSLCGISGCSGGGFGRAYGGPGEVFPPLVVSGVFAVVPFVVLGLRPGRRRWLVVAAVALVAVPLIGMLLMGIGFDGYPRSVPHEFGTEPIR